MSSFIKTIGFALKSPSVTDEEFERQLNALRNYPVEEIRVERIEGDESWTTRAAIIEGSPKGTELVVQKFEYFARSTLELSKLTSRLRERKLRLIVLSFAGRTIKDSEFQGLDFADLTLGMAEFESGRARHRNIAGLQAARSQGRLLGRPPIPTDLENRISALHAQGGISAKRLADSMGVSRATVFRVLKKKRQA